jgi:hypothetical protein
LVVAEGARSDEIFFVVCASVAHGYDVIDMEQGRLQRSVPHQSALAPMALSVIPLEDSLCLSRAVRPLKWPHPLTLRNGASPDFRVSSILAVLNGLAMIAVVPNHSPIVDAVVSVT